jgi:hypothetical protein
MIFRKDIRIPADMSKEIAKYRRRLVEETGKRVEMQEAVRRILQLGLNALNAKAMRSAPVASPLTQPSAQAPLSAPAPSSPSSATTPASAPRDPREVLTHAWTPGLILPCGLWSRGNRRAGLISEVTCPVCRAKMAKK